MDVRIVEHVYGWRVEWSEDDEAHRAKVWSPTQDRAGEFVWWKNEWGTKSESGYATCDVPYSSTDDAVALTALAKVGGIAIIVRVWPDEWRVILGDEAASGDTLALAICRVLLAAARAPLAGEATGGDSV